MRNTLAASLAAILLSSTAHAAGLIASPVTPVVLPAAVAAQVAGAVQATGGNAGATVMLPSSTGAINKRALAARAGDRPAIGDYAPQGQPVGGASRTIMLSAQAAGDTSMLVQPNSNGALNVGRFVAAIGLPASTYISGIGGSSAVSPSFATSAGTLTDAHNQALATMIGMSNQLTFAGTVILPNGATATGPGIPTGATVVGIDTTSLPGSTSIYISANVTADVAVGASIGFSYSAQTVYLSHAWTTASAIGGAVGTYAQDDYAAFQNAAFYLAPQAGGTGGRIWVPSGSYYLSQNVTTYQGVSFELGADVSFVPGSATIDAQNGGYSASADATFEGGDRSQVGSELVVTQVLEQRLLPDLQGQGLLINELNAGCTNGGGGWGCGQVGEEVKQAAGLNISQGTMWAYHSTDTVGPGQTFEWAGAELEMLNNSGIDVKWDQLKGNKIGLHIDNLGNTDNTVVLLPGARGTGEWHRALDCGTSAVRDYCWDVLTGPLAANGTPTMLAGLDMSGNLTAASLITAGAITAGGTLTAAVLRAGGSLISNPEVAAYTLLASDCGTTIEPLPPSAMTITVPSGLPNGCTVNVSEINTIQITFAAGPGQAMRAIGGATKITANFGAAKVLIDGPSTFLLSGNIQ